MKVSSNGIDAIVDLHKRGFTNDFQLVGNDLMWAQESLVIRVGEFTIARYQKIDDLIVCGVVALHYNIKGILLGHCNDFSDVSPVLIKKLKELNVLERQWSPEIGAAQDY